MLRVHFAVFTLYTAGTGEPGGAVDAGGGNKVEDSPSHPQGRNATPACAAILSMLRV